MGVSWNDIPEKHKPHWSTWNIKGTPFEETQKRLHAKGLHDPWLRNEVWIYRLPKSFASYPHLLKRGMLPGFVLFLGLLSLKNYYSDPNKPTHH